MASTSASPLPGPNGGCPATRRGGPERILDVLGPAAETLAAER